MLDRIYNNGITTEIEQHFTQEDIDNQAKAEKQRQIDDINTELAQLDTQVSRMEEDIITFTKMPVYPSKQAVIDRKSELRKELTKLS